MKSCGVFGCFFFLFGLLPIVLRCFANQCKNSSHTRESMTDKASWSIGYGAKNTKRAE